MPSPASFPHSGFRPAGLPSLARPARYRIGKPLGEGATSFVYLAQQLSPCCTVAMKCCKPGPNPHLSIARFDAERQALARLHHPNIVRLYDAGISTRGWPYLVLEYIPGLPITEFCRRRQLGLRARLALFLRLASAVHHAHQHGIIHRDLKPSNVLVTLQHDQPIPKIIDFSHACAVSPQPPSLPPSVVPLGTPGYRSPEQTACGDAIADVRTDVYSLGAILLEILTGLRPSQLRKLRPPLPSTGAAVLGNPILARQFRGSLDAILTRALAINPARRYASASALAAAVARHVKAC